LRSAGYRSSTSRSCVVGSRSTSSRSPARARVLYYRLPWIDVYHEELVGRSEETLERVLEFLGVEPRADDLESSFVAVDDVPRAEVLENLDEVRAALEGTRFAWMASDPTPAAGPPTAFDATVRTPS
jgi:hypothetical protein